MTEVGSLPPSNMKSIGIPLDAISIANLLNGRKSANVFEEDTDGKPNFGAPGAKILVVDDLSTNLAVVVGLLRLYDVHADTAQSGQDAINSMQRKDYDLVFMDHMMPGMDGVEAVRRIRSLGGNCGNVPVVALTANAMIGMREFFIQHGFNDFISKPIEPEKLQTALIKWLPPQLRIAKKGD
jgi:CheY-like chemotaxis protein